MRVWKTLRDIGINVVALLSLGYAIVALVVPLFANGLQWGDCYVFVLIINGFWVAVSAALAATSSNPRSLTNLWQDSLVPVVFAVLLVACALVVDSTGAIRAMDTDPIRWVFSFVGGLAANTLTFLDTRFQRAENKISPDLAKGWTVQNLLVIVVFLGAFIVSVVFWRSDGKLLSWYPGCIGPAAVGVLLVVFVFAVAFEAVKQPRRDRPAPDSVGLGHGTLDRTAPIR